MPLPPLHRNGNNRFFKLIVVTIVFLLFLGVLIIGRRLLSDNIPSQIFSGSESESESGNTLGLLTDDKYDLRVYIDSFFEQPVRFLENVTSTKSHEIQEDLTVLGETNLEGNTTGTTVSADELTSLTINTDVLNLTNTAAINNLLSIDGVTKATLEGTLELAGDVTGSMNATLLTNIGGVSLGTLTTDDSMLGIVDGVISNYDLTNITTVGTIDTGTWEADEIGVEYGGTGLTDYSGGDMLYATGGSELDVLNIGSNGYILGSDGDEPSWVEPISWLGLDDSASATGSGAYLIGVFDEFANSNATNLQAVLNDFDQAMATGVSTLWTDAGTHIYANNYPQFVVTDSGRVGVGTSTPSYVVEVVGSLSTSSLYIAGNQVTSTSAELNLLDNATAQDGGILVGDGTGFSQDTSDLFWNNVSNYLGVGTSAPQYTLDVAGNIHLSAGSTVYIGTIGIGDTGTTPATSGASLIGVYPEFNYTTATNVQDVLDDLDQAIFTVGATSAQWTDTGTRIFANNYNQVAVTDNGRMGIGTSAPSSALEVIGEARATRFAFQDDIDTYIDTVGANELGIYTGDSARIIIDGAGLIGIGRTNPQYQLDVQGDVRISSLGSGTTNFVVTQSSGLLQTRAIDSRVWDSTLIDGAGVTNMVARFTDQDTLTIGTIFDNGTRVGIGTSTPSYLLDVAGTLNTQSLFLAGSAITATASELNKLDGVSTTTTELNYLNNLSIISGGVLFTDGSGITQDITGLYFDSATNFLGIGTSSPQYALDVTGSMRVSNLPGGSANTVVTANSGLLESRTIDSRVWGSTLVDSSGTTNFIPRFSDTNSLVSSSIFDNGTYVGVGTSNPSYLLDVGGSLNTETLFIAGNAVTADSSEINKLDGATVTTSELNYLSGSSVVAGGILVGDGTGITQYESSLFWNNGSNYFGIGTSSPSYTLDVNGNIHVAAGSDLYLGGIGIGDSAVGSSGAGLVGVYDEFTYSDSTFVQDVLDDLDSQIFQLASGATGLWIDAGTYYYPTNAPLSFGIEDTTGYVGIGTSDPTEQLDVVGNIAVTGTVDGVDLSAYSPYFIGSAGNTGEIWSSDGDNAGTWLDVSGWDQNVSDDFSSPMTTIGDLIYAGASGQPNRLAGATTNGYVLKYNTGSNTPYWSADIDTTYTAGDLIDIGGTDINVDLSELATSSTDGDGDYFVVVDDSNNQYKLTKANISLSGFNDDLIYDNYIDWKLFSDGAKRLDVGTTTPVGFDSGSGISITWDGSRDLQFALTTLTGNWSAGAYDISSSTFTSNVIDGTAPFTVISTTLVDNLNADLLDGQEGSWYMPASTDNWIDESGDTITGPLIFSSVLSDIRTATDEHLTIVPGGNGYVGIGTSSPSYLLDVNGDIRIAAGSDLYLGSIGIGDSAVGASGAGLIGVYDEFTYSDSTFVQGVLKDFDTQLAASGGQWTDGGNYIYANNATDKVAIMDSTGYFGLGLTNPSAYLDILSNDLNVGLVNLVADTLSTTNAVDISLDGLTTGNGINIETLSSALTGSDLISAKHTGAVYTNALAVTGNLFSLERSLESKTSSAEITFDNATTKSAQSTTSITMAHTTGAGTKRMLIVGISSKDENLSQNHVSSISYNGQALTKLVAHDGRFGAETVEIWYLKDPPIGSYNVVVTYPGGDPTAHVVVGAVTYFGVDQTDSFGPVSLSNNGAFCDPSIDVVSDTGQLVLDFISAESSSVAPGSGQTARYINTDVTSRAGHSTEPGAATVTMNWSNAGSVCVMVGVSMKTTLESGLEIHGDLAELSSTCYSDVDEECVDYSNILSLAQNYIYATGDVLDITNAGTGSALNVDTTNSGGSGMVIDIESASIDDWVFWATSNDSAITGLYVGGNGSVGIGTTAPTAKLDVAGNIVVSGTVDGVDLSTYSPYFINSAGNTGEIWSSDGDNAGTWLDVSAWDQNVSDDFSSPMTSIGDLIYAGNGGQPNRLAGATTNGYVLKYNTGTDTPYWGADGNTTYIAGDLIDIGDTDINVDLSELATSSTDGDGDYFVVVDDSNNQYKLTKGNINLSGFNDDLVYDNYIDWKLFSDGANRLDVGTTTPVGFDSGSGISITWDGSRDLQFALTTLTGNWNAGAYDIASSTFTSNVIDGTAPFTIVSKTLVDNLNADLLDGQEGSWYMPASTDNWVNESGDTLTGGLIFSGVLSDIVSPTDEHISIVPGGNGYVGVGTSNPGYMLDVNGAIRVVSGSDLYIGNIAVGDTGADENTSGATLVGVYPQFNYSNNTNVQDVLDDLDQAIFTIGASAAQWTDTGSLIYANNYNQVSVTDSGRMGIGLTNPQYKLDVAGDVHISSGNDLLIGSVGIGDSSSATNSGAFLVGLYSSNLNNSNATTVQYVIEDLDSAIQSLATGQSGLWVDEGSMYYPSNAVGAFSILDTSGYLGLGTTAPSEQLTVDGNIAVTGTVDGVDISTYSPYFINSAGNTGEIWSSDGDNAGTWLDVSGWDQNVSDDFSSPMTTIGDLVYLGSGGNPQRLAGATTNGYVLKYNTGTDVPYWSEDIDTDTTYTAGDLIDIGGTDINVDLSELAQSSTDGDGDYFVVLDDSNNQYKLTKGNINLSGFNDDLIYDNYIDWKLFSDGAKRLDVGTTTPVGFDSGSGISITWDGSRDLQFALTTLTGNWNAGAYDITSSTFTSNVIDGTAPFTVVSTTLVDNLNADLLDGQEGSWYMPASTDNWVDESGDTMTGGLIFSGVLSDIVSATDEHISIVPGGNGYVGIGTSSPSYMLDVNGDIHIASGSDLYIGNIRIGESDTPTTSGAYLIGVNNQFTQSTSTNVQDVLDDLDYEIEQLATGSTGLWIDAGSYYYPTNASLSFGIEDTTGYLGVGTSDPTEQLDVVGNIAVSGTVDGVDISTYSPYFINSAGNTGEIWSSDGDNAGTWLDVSGWDQNVSDDFSSPITSIGDLIYAGSGGQPNRLAGATTNGYVLKYNTGTDTPYWSADIDTNTTYTAGDLIDIGGTDINVDLSELAQSSTDGDGDYFVVVDASNNQYKLTKGNINLSGFNDDLTYDDYGDWNLYSNGTERLSVGSAGNIGFDSLNGISITWDGTRDLQFGLSTLTGNWNAGNYDISSSTFTSTVTTGTAPFTVASTTRVVNLNADLLDGEEGTYYTNASNITAGTLSNLYFSAYGDLSAENYLNNDDGGDLLTRDQMDTRYVNDGCTDCLNDTEISDIYLFNNVDDSTTGTLTAAGFVFDNSTLNAEEWSTTSGDIILDPAGNNILPGSDATDDLGASGTRFKDIYYSGTLYGGSTIQISDSGITDTNSDLNFTSSTDGFNFTLAGESGDDFNIDSGTFVLESDTNQVGINIADPAYDLDVGGSLNALNIFVNGVGIGDSSSATTSGAYLVGVFDEFGYSNSTTVQDVLDDLDYELGQLASGQVGLWIDTGTYLYPTNAETGFSIMDTNGWVGIGTTAPTDQLHVVGNIVVTGNVDGVDLSDYSSYFIDAAGNNGEVWTSDGSGVGGYTDTPGIVGTNSVSFLLDSDGTDSSDIDMFLYFNDETDRYLMWDDGNSRFGFSDNLYVNGTITATGTVGGSNLSGTNSGDVSAVTWTNGTNLLEVTDGGGTQSATITGFLVDDADDSTTGNLSAATFRSGSHVYINYDGVDGDSSLYFYDGASATGQSLTWDDDPGEFTLSADLNVTGGVEVSDDLYIGSIGLGDSASSTTSGAYLVGAFDEFTYADSTTVQGVLNDLDDQLNDLTLGNEGLWIDAGSYIFANNASDKIAIADTTGYFGIGTTNPEYQLQIGSTPEVLWFGPAGGDADGYNAYITKEYTFDGVSDYDVANLHVGTRFKSSADETNEQAVGFVNVVESDINNVYDLPALQGINNSVYHLSPANISGALGDRNVITIRENSGNVTGSAIASFNAIAIYSGYNKEITGNIIGTLSSTVLNGGTAPNVYLFKGEADTTVSTTTTNVYGLHINNLVGTNTWGIYLEGADDNNYIAGSLGIGTTNALASLHVDQGLGATEFSDGFEDGTLSPFTTSGDANWTVQSGTTYNSSSYAAEGGNTTNSEITSLNLDVNLTNPSIVSFYVKTSSEANYDFLSFYVDDIYHSKWSGETDWTLYETYLSSGSHTLEWVYSKDGAADSGSDTAWIDNVQIVNQNTSTLLAGSVGINKTNPQYSLDINGQINTTNSYLINGTTALNIRDTSVYVGEGAGSKAYSGSNVMIGYLSGNNTTTAFNSTFTGYLSGESITTGSYNSFYGSYAGYDTTTGQANSFLGRASGRSNTEGSFNTFMGSGSGYGNTTGDNNTAIGYYTNWYNQEGDNNTLIGYEAGRGTSAHSKSGSVFLGYQAGYFETSSNKLYIENSASGPNLALIYGDFENDTLSFNADVGIGTTAPTNLLETFDQYNMVQGTDRASIYNTAEITASGDVLADTEYYGLYNYLNTPETFSGASKDDMRIYGVSNEIHHGSDTVMEALYGTKNYVYIDETASHPGSGDADLVDAAYGTRNLVRHYGDGNAEELSGVINQAWLSGAEGNQASANRIRGTEDIAYAYLNGLTTPGSSLSVSERLVGTESRSYSYINGSDLPSLFVNEQYGTRVLAASIALNSSTFPNVGTLYGSKVIFGPAYSGTSTENYLETAYGTYITTDFNTGGYFTGEINNLYGLYIDDMSGGTTNSYSIYSVAGDNYFGGNLGIGTLPTVALDVSGQMKIAGDILPAGDDTYDLGSNSYRWQDLYLGPSTLHIGSDTSDEYTINYDDLNNRLGFNVNGTGNPEFVMDSNGYFGIGTTAPAYNLTVNGMIGIGSNNSSLAATMEFDDTEGKLNLFADNGFNFRGKPSDPKLMSEIYDGMPETEYLNSRLFFEAYDVFKQGNYAYISTYGGSFVVVDIRNPTNPIVKSIVYDGNGEFTKLSGLESVYVSGNYAYVVSALESALTIIDVSNPSDPTLVSEVYDGDGEFSRLGQASGIFVSGNYAYVTAEADNALTIMDISNPSDPVLMSEVYDGDGEFSRLNGATSVTTEGNYTYVVSFDDRSLTIMDISNPSDPVLMSEVYDGDGEFSLLSGATSVDIVGNYAYVASFYDNSLTIMDISNPSDPVLMSEVYDGDGEFSKLSNPTSVFIDGNYAYIGSSIEYALTIVDISNPADPVLQSEIYNGDGEFTSLSSVSGVGVSENIVYILSWNSLTIADITDKTDPSLLSVLNNGNEKFSKLRDAISVFVDNNYAYVVSLADDALSIIDVSDPSNPLLMSEVYDGDGEFSLLEQATSVYVSGNYAYIASGIDDSITIVDISDPTDPVLMSEVYDEDGEFSRLNRPESVYISGNYAYVAASFDHTLAILDISNPSDPSLVSEVYDGDGEFSRLSYVNSVYVSGNYAYVTSGDDNALTIMDISNPSDPDLMAEVYDGDGEFSRLSFVNSVYVSGNYAYVTSRDDNALTIMDISNPSDPDLMAEVYDGDGEFSRLAGANHVFVEGNYAYVTATGDNSLTILDISDPSDPVLITELYDGDGEFSKLGNTKNIFVSGNYAYVTSTEDALTIIEIGGGKTDFLDINTLYAGKGIFTGDIDIAGNLDISNVLTTSSTLTKVKNNFEVVDTSYFGNNVSIDGNIANTTGLTVSQINSGDILNLFSGSNEVLTVTNEGYLGIGTTAPQTPLHIVGNGLFDGNIYIGSTLPTISDTDFMLDGDDMFISGVLGVESDIYTDGAFRAGNDGVAYGRDSISYAGAESFRIDTNSLDIRSWGFGRPVQVIPAGTFPTRNMAIGDFNNDSVPDMVSPDYTDGKVLVFINEGNGTFEGYDKYQATSTGSSTYSVSVADFNNDKYDDIVAANQSDNEIAVFINKGDGTFNSKNSYTTDTKPRFTGTGDFNNDGYVDIVASNYDSDTLSVFINNGNGTFASKVPYNTGSSPSSITIADYNRDTYLDIVVSNNAGDSVSVFINDGDGTFASKVDYTITLNSTYGFITTADFNMDGYHDIAASDYSTDTVTILLNDKDGTFTSSDTFTVGYHPMNIINTDLNNDGLVDLVTANMGEDTISILVNTGSAGFKDPIQTQLTRDPWSVYSADFDMDGNMDIAIQKTQGNGAITVYPGNGNATFGAISEIETSTVTGAIKISDIDLDGLLDIVTTEGESTDSLTVYKNMDGYFFKPNEIIATGTSPHEMVLTDFNNDGYPDIASSNSYNSTQNAVSVVLSNGDGTFADPVYYNSNEVYVYEITSDDFNNDSFQDIVVTYYNPPSSFSVYYNKQDGTFTDGVDYSLGNDIGRTIQAGDINNDGLVDIVAGSSTLSTHLNIGDSTFSSGTFFGPEDPTGIALGDFNKDSFLDIAVSSDEHNRVYFNDGTGTYTEYVDYAAPVSVYSSMNSVDINNDGYDDLVAQNQNSGTISIYINKKDGTFNEKIEFLAGARDHSFDFADLNNDGLIDIVQSNYQFNRFQILYNGAGTNRIQGDLRLDGDFDLDGRLYLAHQAIQSGDTALMLIESDKAGLTSFTGSNLGTYLGVNADSTFGGNLLDLQVDGVSKMVLDSNGYLGIGTTAAQSYLQVGEYFDPWRYVNNGDLDGLNVSFNDTLINTSGDTDIANVLVNTIATSTAVTNDQIFGLISDLNTDTSASTSFPYLYSSVSDIDHSSPQSANRLTGASGRVYSYDGSGSVTTIFGNYGLAHIYDGAGSVDSAYGGGNYAIFYNDTNPITSYIAGGKNASYIYADSLPVPLAYGTISEINLIGTTEITDAKITMSQADLDAGSIDDLYLFYADIDGTSTSVDRAYGFYSEDLPGTNSWSLYLEGADDDNFIAGNLGVGMTNPTYKLDVYGDSRIRGSIYAIQTAVKIEYVGGLSRNSMDFYGNGGLSTSNNGNLYLTPNGTGDVFIDNGNLAIGYGTATNKIQLDSDTYATNTGWVDSSNRELKHNFENLENVVLPNITQGTWEGNGEVIESIDYDLGSANLTDNELLERINKMPLYSYSFIDDDEVNEINPGEEIRHLGPTAQDFYKLFGLGGKDTSIRSTDMAGVALAGVKALDAKIDNIQVNEFGEINTEIENVTDSLQTAEVEIQNLWDHTTDIQQEFDSNSILIDELTSDVLGLQTEVADLRTLVDEMTAESTESTEASQSTMSIASILPEDLQKIFDYIATQITDTISSLGLSKSEDGESLVVETALNVMGDATFNNAIVTGDLEVGFLTLNNLENSFEIKGPSCISTVTGLPNEELCDLQTLFIQKNLAGKVDFMNGQIVFEPNGDINVAGVLSAEEVRTDKLSISSDETSETVSVGEVIIPMGAGKMLVTSNAMTEKSMIFVTSNKPVAIGTEKISATEFEITLSEIQPEDTKVSWWIVN